MISFLFRVLGLIRLGRIGICHLRVLGTLLGLLSLGLLARLLLGSLLGLNLGLDRLPVGLDLFKVSLDDGAGQCTDLVNLGDVDGLGSVLAILVQPVLQQVSNPAAIRQMRLG